MADIKEMLAGIKAYCKEQKSCGSCPLLEKDSCGCSITEVGGVPENWDIEKMTKEVAK